MFDIGFGELLLVFVIGLVVLGPQRLPVAVRTVAGWIRTLRSLAASVQNELAQELKLQELQDNLKKVEEASKNSLSPELKASVEELRQSAEAMKRAYRGENEQEDDNMHTIHREQDAANTPGLSAQTIVTEVAKVTPSPDVARQPVPADNGHAPSTSSAVTAPSTSEQPQGDKH
ncbi:MAG: Sec-independent protein translocase protein TatB [Candidatus Erwinia impunctatus]